MVLGRYLIVGYLDPQGSLLVCIPCKGLETLGLA